MKSGLRDRNNIETIIDKGIVPHPVSMKSGLRDRNNEEVGAFTEPREPYRLNEVRSQRPEQYDSRPKIRQHMDCRLNEVRS